MHVVGYTLHCFNPAKSNLKLIVQFADFLGQSQKPIFSGSIGIFSYIVMGKPPYRPVGLFPVAVCMCLKAVFFFFFLSDWQGQGSESKWGSCEGLKGLWGCVRVSNEGPVEHFFFFLKPWRRRLHLACHLLQLLGAAHLQRCSSADMKMTCRGRFLRRIVLRRLSLILPLSEFKGHVMTFPVISSLLYIGKRSAISLAILS